RDWRGDDNAGAPRDNPRGRGWRGALHVGPRRDPDGTRSGTLFGEAVLASGERRRARGLYPPCRIPRPHTPPVITRRARCMDVDRARLGCRGERTGKPAAARPRSNDRRARGADPGRREGTTASIASSQNTKRSVTMSVPVAEAERHPPVAELLSEVRP